MPLQDILVVEDARLRVSIAPAIHAVDTVHLCPKISPVPIMPNRSRREQGSYHFALRPRRPLRIVISRYAASPSWTFLHELGHLLDNTALNAGTSDFAGESSPIFDNLRRVWKSCPHVQSLHDIFQRHARHEPPPSRNAFLYELTASELWARTYVQWIATKSASPILLSALHQRAFRPFFFGGKACVLEWDNESFKAIMASVDELMSKAGLL